MRLLLIEDDTALRSVLERGFRLAGFAVDQRATAEEALQLVRVNPYDVMVLDLGLPDMDGLDLLRQLRQSGLTLPVLILTARGGVEERVIGLDAGADDYLLKPFALPELLARVRALMRRGEPLLPSVLRVADLELDPARYLVRRAGRPIALTVKEFALLEYLMRHAGEVVTRATLLESCWDESYDGLSNLVDVHVSRLRRKLDVPGTPPLLHTIRGAGFALGERLGERAP